MVFMCRSLQTQIFNNVQCTAGLQNIVFPDIYYRDTWIQNLLEIQEYKYYKDTWIKEYIDKRIHKYKILGIQGYRKSDIHKNMNLRIHWYKDTLV